MGHMRVFLFLVALAALAAAQTCSNPKTVAQSLSLSTDHTFVVGDVDIVALFVEVAPCLGITLPSPSPAPCGAGCRNITQNLAIGAGGCLIVNGTDVVARLQEIQMTCPCVT